MLLSLDCFRYVFGVTHIPRLEDWPVMPVERLGFMLMVLLVVFSVLSYVSMTGFSELIFSVHIFIYIKTT